VAATMIGMLLLSWELALFAFALIPIFVFLTRRVGNERRRIAKSTQETLADISSLVQESLSVSGILLGKTMGRGNELADRFEADSLRLASLEVRQRMAGRWVMAAIQTSFAIMPAAVYWFGGLALANGSNAISIAELVAFTTLQTRLFFPVGSLLGVSLDIQTSLALFDRIFEYLDAPIDIVEKPDAVTEGRAGDVVFDDVWFRYGEEWTLQDVSFTVPAGTTTALVGETGSGKTTLGYLTARLYDVDRGRITIGGTDIRDLSLSALSELVGVVSQETYLFHATVRENLAFAKPDATDAEIVAAAEAARIDHVISALPEGYDTVVGERGYRFSGGEKQRIAIAARSSATRRSSSSTRRPAPSTPRPSGSCRRRSTGSPKAARRLRSRTASRPCATPTRSSCSTAAASSNAAATTTSSTQAAATRRWPPATPSSP
jgi:ABC-type multidrug transport system, ATPase and permease components